MPASKIERRVNMTCSPLCGANIHLFASNARDLRRRGRHVLALVPAFAMARLTMLTLYSYPTLFGVADNNGYGLKVFAFLKLAGVPFVPEHIFDGSSAPPGPLPSS